ncbi:hypothetical protein [Mameliella sp. MMSF_3455]|uniref:hypothetical protein n=1 Tax=Mameliella sp. MMSF_3455 TaxID=3046714 RepID=UPI00273D8DC9|nr:hypothetical protein [Mameliella sp. MMSF_3455]
MTDYSISTLAVPGGTGSASLVRDPLLSGLDAGAMRFAFDLDFSWCYPGGPLASRPAQTDPVREQVVYDLCERSDGAYTNADYFEAPTAAYAGGGFDFGATDIRNPWGVRGPADAWNPIHAADNAYFMVCAYFKMPTQAKWKPSGGFVHMFSSQTANGYYTQPEPLSFAQIDGQIRATRQRNTVGAARDSLSLTPTSAHYDKLCQLSYWRNADGQGFRMKSADGTVSTTMPVGDENVEDYTGLAPVWGDARTAVNGAYSSEDALATDVRLYRGFMEDLNASGRDPETVLDADWTRVQARIAASGGTIFV